MDNFATSDPFDVVKEEAQEKFKTVTALYERWKELLDQPNSSTTDEIDWIQKELETKIEDMEWDLRDLEETIQIVEENPHKFDKLDSSELASRKNFIEQTKKTVNAIKSDVTNPTRFKQKQNQKKNLRNRDLLGVNEAPKDKYGKLDDFVDKENQEYINEMLLTQSRIKEDQNRDLEGVSRALDKVKEITLDIGNEMDDQDVLLGELKQDVDKTHGLLKRTRRQLNNLLKNSSDRGKLIAIVVLVIIIIVLITVFFVLN